MTETTTPTTARGQAKARRWQELLTASTKLFADRGYAQVSIDDIGSAAGVSGPAVYRHFSSKQAILGEILKDVSRNLRAGGQRVVETYEDPNERLRQLISFQVDFALSNPTVIVVQDREFTSLTEVDRREVRTLQRSYVTQWVQTLSELAPGREVAELTVRAQAVFGLINSTPHSNRVMRELNDPRSSDRLNRARTSLEHMAWAALATAFESTSPQVTETP